MAVQVGRKWHLVRTDGILGTGCGRALGDGPHARARTVAMADRCQARGCEEAWPPQLRLVG